MTWKLALIERKVQGAPSTCKVYFTVQDNDHVRLFIVHGPKIRFTKAYPTLHDGLTRLVEDYKSSAKAS